MEPQIQANGDGTLTIRITPPAATDARSMLTQGERLMEASNAVGRAGAAHWRAGFDAQGQPLLPAGRQWTSKGRIAKCDETPWGEVVLDRHLSRPRGGGATLCPLERRARLVGGAATPHLARSLGHQYANNPARAVVRALEENHARKLAPSYGADIAPAMAAPAMAAAAGPPIVEQNAQACQSPPAEVASAVLGPDGAWALFCEEGYQQCRRP